MKHAGQSVTIYHALYDPDKGYDIYTGKVFDGVSFFGGIATNVSKDGLTAAVTATMRIPAALDAHVMNGDLVLLGAHQTVGKRPADLADMVDYVYTVVGVTDNTAGREPHTKVVMK